MPFDLLETGGLGHLDIRLRDEREVDDQRSFPRLALPVGLPPVLSPIESLVEDFVSNPSRLPLFNQIGQRLLPWQHKCDRLLAIDLCAPQSTIEISREGTRPTSNCIEVCSKSNLNVDLSDESYTNLTDNGGPTLGHQLPEYELESARQDFESALSFEIRINDGEILPIDQWPLPMTLEELSNIAVDITELFKNDEKEKTNKVHPEQVSTVEINDATLFALIDSTCAEEELEIFTEQSPCDRGEKQKPIMSQKSTSEHKQYAVQLDNAVDDFHSRIPNMAFKWRFELDVFQKQAILCLEEGKSVLVAAHTSAGKTAVAEYAIALALKHSTRAVYTSPVKALSNQKYRELKGTFDDVGLLTGDVQINDTASCLIVTTEILRLMLYEGSEIIRELEWVIIDEVHYINDASRGVVWEEVLILLPDYVKLVLLSATVPNTMELAEWIRKLKKKPVYVVATKERPVQLAHYLYTGYPSPSNNGLYLFCNENGQFLDTEYARATACLKNNEINENSKIRDKNLWLSTVKLLKKEDKLPAIAFCFSKKKISMTCRYFKDVTLTSSSEKAEIKAYFSACINKLKNEDQLLPQVKEFQQMLQRGFGIHHSGVLPILREMIEILFQKSLIKILFATETFAMGVNMPAKTVIFDDVIKHDGKSFRPLHTGEYIQMSGRAGRRGLDEVGYIIILCKADAPDKHDLHRMVLGKPSTLESRFRLSYSMILHLFNVEQLQVQDMMRRSFSAFNNKKESSEMLEKIKTELPNLSKVECFLCSLDLGPYYDSCKEFYRLLRSMQRAVVSHPSNVMVPGRIIMVKGPRSQAVFGVIFEKLLSDDTRQEMYQTFALCDPFKDGTESGIHPVKLHAPFIHLPDKPELTVITVTCEDVFRVTKSKTQINLNDVIKVLGKHKISARHLPECVISLIQELVYLSRHNPYGLKGFEPVQDFQMTSTELVENLKAVRLLAESFTLTDKYSCLTCADFSQHFYTHDSNINMKEKHKELQHLLSDEYLTLLPEYNQMSKVLTQLNYINGNDKVELKGRIACHFAKHEIVLTEVIMENVFGDMSPAEMAALLCCFVLDTNKCKLPKLSGKLLEGKSKITSIATQVGHEQRKADMLIPVDVFVHSLHFGMTLVVYNWALGKSFSEVITLTNLEEGIIVKTIQALHETLGRVEQAGKLMGNDALSGKCQEAKVLIKRDIIFASSLYLQ